mmetsp:Transcript_94072/g.147960  ORF Transcript_94072/g.147960 Transcript_94072/m.147960 type:complete len:514 (+) Transcript_94072:68-1609(+)
MSKDIVIRLSSKAGRSRIVLPSTATYEDLQVKVQESTKVDPASQRLARDEKGTQIVTSAQKTPLSMSNIVNGTQLWLINEDANIAAQVLTPVKVSVEEEKVVPKNATSSDSNSTATATTPAVSKEPGKSGEKDLAKKPQDGSTWSDKADREAPFQCFDSFIRKSGYGTHALPGNQVYTPAKLKAGGQIKLPPSRSIKQQPYRHVDQLSIYNRDEMGNFLGYWNEELLPEARQRVGWMYGYYIEDGNYGEKDMNDGTRAIVEAIYEPPQDMVGEDCVMLDDPDMPTVKKIVEALGLECVGWVFTSFPLDDDMLLTPNEVQRIARLQLDHSTDAHFTKYRLSKFVTCAVRPDTQNGGRPGLNPFMVSDQCVAMVRDGMISANADPRNCVVREPEKGELMPDFLVESKANKVINTDFFVIRVVDSVPKKLPPSIFTHSDFPRENRPRHMQQRDDLKKYCRKRAKDEPTWSKYADFHFLLYVAKALDVDTAIQLCEAVRDRKEISEGTKMLIEAIVA